MKKKPNMPRSAKNLQRKKSKRFFWNYEICYVCGVKMRIAPCEVEKFCPKCGLIKDNVFFYNNPSWEKKPKDYYLLRRIKHFLQLKGLNFDVMFIERVVVAYNTVNEFAASDKKIKYSFHIPTIIAFVPCGETSESDFFVNRFWNITICSQADHPLLVGTVANWNLSNDLLLFIEEIRMNNTVAIICSKMQNLKQIFQ